MDSTNNIATDLFYKVRSRFSGLKLGAETGEITINPEEARFFDFDYMEDNNAIGHVSVSLAEPNSMKVYFSHGITEGMDDSQKKNWYGFLRELRGFAKRRLLSFDTRDIAKDNLDKRDYEFLSQNAQPKQQMNTIQKPVGESMMKRKEQEKTQAVTEMDKSARQPGRDGHVSHKTYGSRDNYELGHSPEHTGKPTKAKDVVKKGTKELEKAFKKVKEDVAEGGPFNYGAKKPRKGSVAYNAMMSESAMYGSRTISYQKLMDTRLIVKHSQAVMDDAQPGARTRNISALFVENQDGERFKYPFIHLAGARAMQRHVANGGLPYDEVGKSIVRMSEEIAALKSFSGYVVRNDLMNSDTNEMVERSNTYLNSLREQIKALAKQSHYENYIENFQATNNEEIPQEVVEQFKEKFTIKTFREDIANVFPVLFKLMKENDDIGYDDIVAMAQEELQNENVEIDTNTDNFSGFDKFEQWVMNLGEESNIVSEDPEEQQAAIRELQELISQHFPAGVDGTNAIESLKGIIEDPTLYADIKEAAKQDPDTCVRGLVKDWLETNVPEIIEQLDFGDFVDEPQMQEPDIAAEVPAEQPQMADMDQEQSQKLNVSELAEFIQSFYDRKSNTFPKGPEGVAVMVGKKFGEQAEQVARKFVERMAPQQSTEQNPELQQLARMKELAGM